MEELWFCGKIIRKKEWTYEGIFSTKDKAIRRCKDNNYFIAPVNVDEEIPDEITVFPNIEFPYKKRE